MSTADEDEIVHAERVVLGALMYADPTTMVDAIARLDQGADFRLPSHRVIYRVIVELWAADVPPDPSAVWAEVGRRAAADRATPHHGLQSTDLTDMVAVVPNLAMVPYYVAKVAAAGDRRRTAEALALAAERIGKGADVDQVAGDVVKVLASRGRPARSGRRARVTWADTIDPEPVVWAWTDEGEGRIPAGALSLAAGREGTGKSSFGLWITAQVSRGLLPGSFYGTPRPALYAAVEDSWKHTLVPRLIAAGADRSKVARFDVVQDDDAEVALSLPVDNDLLEETITDLGAALVVIDPLMSALDATLDSHRTREVRRALDPLAGIADRTGAVILGIAHFNKSSGTDVAQLITGSGAFKDVPRAVFGFARDDSEDASAAGGRVMTQVKNSLGRDDLPSLTYGIASAVVETGRGTSHVGRLHFTGRTDRTVADVLSSSSAPDPDAEADRAEAADWLRDYLTGHGGEASPRDIEKAGRADGFSTDQLKRAKRKAGVRSEKSSMAGPWVWRIDVTDSNRQRSGGSIPEERGDEARTEGSTCAASNGDHAEWSVFGPVAS
ncbi:hypothetical protein E0F15_08905 [Frankia sp. B2]|uniref:AAA family ATPase n=1 Tax=Frankia TaxID=1854 RepID=UPI0003D02FDD|nr:MULTISPECIES: AAA family ATPase [Frankia]ETA04218.1 replicative DNA helicase [Frankia sp. CcI6]KDA44564.1 replicative DNA helicase [Frankia sp. BMG5.23]KFB05567.1 replicative DNA helicase [Frankia sp. Allo2]OAA27660.1 replicative DNA helicase [Frankia casuarinae]OHV47639.1 hypothetical protein CgIS1_06525 [Frankia sp. CgIS1]